MTLSRSAWRKVAATTVAAFVFAFLFDFTVFDSSHVRLGEFRETVSATAGPGGSGTEARVALGFTATFYCKGETTASGTCSCAAAVAAMVKEKTERAIEVEMPGGHAKIQWRDDGEVVITGSAEVIYAGQWLALIP